MEQYLDLLFLDIFNVKLNEKDKDKCLFELDFMVEKILYIIVKVCQHYNIEPRLYYENVNICSFNEILGICKDSLNLV